MSAAVLRGKYQRIERAGAFITSSMPSGRSATDPFGGPPRSGCDRRPDPASSASYRGSTDRISTGARMSGAPRSTHELRLRDFDRSVAEQRKPAAEVALHAALSCRRAVRVLPFALSGPEQTLPVEEAPQPDRQSRMLGILAGSTIRRPAGARARRSHPRITSCCSIVSSAAWEQRASGRDRVIEERARDADARALQRRRDRGMRVVVAGGGAQVDVAASFGSGAAPLERAEHDRGVGDRLAPSGPAVSWSAVIGMIP